MTNIGHFRDASELLEGKRDIPVKLWVAPPTKTDQKQLSEEVTTAPDHDSAELRS
jgi:aconitate hydratase 2/2-methylisocitrate dehydratase